MPTLRALASPLLLAVAACVSSTTQTRWDRPGAAPGTVARDHSDCSAIAWTEAERLNPYGLGGPSMGTTADSGGLERRRNIDDQRFEMANRFTALCMENRGYKKAAADAR